MKIARRFELVRLLGSGGMGRVWLARDAELQANVAIKFLPPGFEADPLVVERFAREARVGSRLNSPHIVRALDSGLLPDRIPYIVMEHVDGEDLLALVTRDRALTVAQTRQIVCQICDALAAVHALGIVHRDVKPANILIEEHGGDLHAKLADFGIAGEQDSSITRSGACIGTPSYMSPEQILGRRSVNPQWDLWSLAAVAFHCLTGRPPFPGKTFGAICLAIQQGKRAPTDCTWPLARELEQWFCRALNLDSHKRFSTARELGETFDAACSLVPESGTRIRIGAAAKRTDTAVNVATTVAHRPAQQLARGGLPWSAALLTLMLGCIAPGDTAPSGSRIPAGGDASARPSAAAR